jgi:uncharacterized SAM-binding protein YcdF (DUF218 family)
MLPKLIGLLLLPPGILLIVIAVGVALQRRRPQLGRMLALGGLTVLFLLSTPLIADALAELVAGRTPFVAPERYPADAIVVLGAGTYWNAPEYGADTVSRAGLERLRYAARLHRLTGKPVLVTGGQPFPRGAPEADSMKLVLEQELGVPVRWSESESINTLENATRSYRILGPEGKSRIYLVTHSAHMARARRAFEEAGFHVVPAPTGFSGGEPLTILSFAPRADALLDSQTALREILGATWYRIKYALSSIGLRRQE